MRASNTKPDAAQEGINPSNQNNARPSHVADSNTPRSNAPKTIGVYDRPKSPLLAQPILLTLVILFLIVTAVLFVLFVVL